MGQCCCNPNGCSVPDDFVIYGSQFTAPTEYANPFLKGRYRITLRGVYRLQFGVDWELLTGGGFKILIPGFAIQPDTVIDGEFY